MRLMHNGQTMESGSFEDGSISCENANDYNNSNDDSEDGLGRAWG